MEWGAVWLLLKGIRGTAVGWGSCDSVGMKTRKKAIYGLWVEGSG